MILARPFRRLVERPIFVVGPGRSGTTVLVNALAHHPSIAGGFGEAPLIARLGEVAAAHQTGEKSDYYRRSLRIPPSLLYRHLRDLAFEASLSGAGSVRFLLRLLRKGRPFRVRAWSAKTFPSEQSASGLRILFPRARFLLATRNGCETVRSRTRFPEFAVHDFETQCRTWAESVFKFAHLTRAPDALVVRQESLARDPDATFREILTFLELPLDPACAGYCRTTLEHPLDESTKRGVDVRHRLLERPPAHADWSPEQRTIFGRHCRRAMEQLGYSMPF